MRSRERLSHLGRRGPLFTAHVREACAPPRAPSFLAAGQRPADAALASHRTDNGLRFFADRAAKKWPSAGQFEAAGREPVQIPTEGGHLFRRDADHRSDLKPAMIPI